MRYLQVARIVLLVSCWLLSAIELGTTADLNAMSVPKFHFSELLFPFIMGILSVVFVYPALVYIGRARKPGVKRLYLPPFIEFPIIGVWALIWGSAAHMETAAWYPPTGFTYLHCDLPQAQGLVDPTTGLSVSGLCQVIRTAHGCPWLIGILSLFGMAATGFPYFYFLFTRGWTTTVWTPISEATFKKPVPAYDAEKTEKETSSV